MHGDVILWCNFCLGYIDLSEIIFQRWITTSLRLTLYCMACFIDSCRYRQRYFYLYFTDREWKRLLPEQKLYNYLSCTSNKIKSTKFVVCSFMILTYKILRNWIALMFIPYHLHNTIIKFPLYSIHTNDSGTIQDMGSFSKLCAF